MNGAILTVAVMLVVARGLSPSALAAGPLDALRARDAQIRQLLSERKQGIAAENEVQLRQAVNGIIDYEAHARASFGRHWEELSQGDRNEALRLVTTLLERSALDKVKDFPQERIQYLSESLDPDGQTATVLTRVKRGGETAEIGYRMQRTGNRWRIVDIVVDGASSVESNRAAFHKEIRNSGVRGLLEKLRRKAERKSS